MSHLRPQLLRPSDLSCSPEAVSVLQVPIKGGQRLTPHLEHVGREAPPEVAVDELGRDPLPRAAAFLPGGQEPRLPSPICRENAPAREDGPPRGDGHLGGIVLEHGRRPESSEIDEQAVVQVCVHAAHAHRRPVERELLVANRLGAQHVRVGGAPPLVALPCDGHGVAERQARW